MKKVKQYKISRRLQVPVFEKCTTQKYAIREQRRKKVMRKNPSEFGKQLIEKQKLRYIYGISEKVLRNYVKKAILAKKISKDETLINCLELRLDNIVYRIGLAPTRRMARQMVSHGHITVNGRKTTIPSVCIKRETDSISIREGSMKNTYFSTIYNKKSKSKVNWLSWDSSSMKGKIIDNPMMDQGIVNVQTVFEYYSR